MKTGSHMFAKDSWPTSVMELDRSERFISKVFRLWVLGLHQGNPAHWSTAWNEFALTFGPLNGKKALGHFSGLIKAFQGYAKQTILYHQPDCPCLGTDEIRIICLIASCQHHDYSLAHRLAGWMVQQEGVGEMLNAGSGFANQMAGNGLELPLRVGNPPLPRDHHPLVRHDTTIH